MNKSIFVLCFLFSQFTLATTWQSVGTRWAEATDNAGKPVGIYDLSFPQFIGPIPIGQIGVTKADLLQTVSDLKLRLANENTEDSAKAIEQLNKVSEADLNNAVLKDDWWADVPWKSAKLRGSKTAPKSFRLSDIDFSQCTSDFESFNSKLSKAEAATEPQGGDPVLGKNILNQVLFQQGDHGTYQIYWIPNQSIDAPKLLIDFQNPKSPMYVNLSWEAVHAVLSGALGLVKLPVITAIAATAIDGVFYFHDLLYRSHLEMLNEMIYSAQDGAEKYSPLASYTKETLQTTEIGWFYSNARLITFLDWLFQDALSDWTRQYNSDVDQSTKSLNWINENHSQKVTLNSRFAISTNELSSKEISILPLAANVLTGRPKTGVDYANAGDVALVRKEMLATYFAVDLGSQLIPVPVVGTVVSWAYSTFVDLPLRTQKVWEARLQAHLEQRAAAGDGNWLDEINIIESQRINPFELSYEASNALVAKRKKNFGLVH